jgi:flagellar biogenesis protein FliO
VDKKCGHIRFKTVAKIISSAKDFSMKRFFLLLGTMLVLVSVPHIWTQLSRTLASCGGDWDETAISVEDSPAPRPVRSFPPLSQRPDRPEGLDFKKSALRMGAYILILSALGGGIIFLKRRGRFFPLAKKGSTIGIRDTLHLGSRNYLAVVECEGRRFLVGITAQGVTPIGPLGNGDLDEKKASLEGKSM